MTESEIETRIAAAKTELAGKKSLIVENTSHQFTEPYVITRRCAVTGEWYSVTVETADWSAWRRLDAPLKPAAQWFPYLNLEEIEFLLSGISPNGIQDIFRNSEIVDVNSED